MWWSELRKYLPTKKKVIVTLVVAIATTADVMSFAPLPSSVLLLIRFAGAFAVIYTAAYLIYGFGVFRESSRTTEAALAITKCCRYLRFEPHDSIHYDIDLVNRLARSQWLRNNHPQWSVARVDADNGSLFLAEGSAVILPGLVFSIMKVGTGISCRYKVKRGDITHEETRLEPSGFQIRAADQPVSFQIDVIDPNQEEVGRDFELERFVAGVLGALNEK